MARRRKTKKRTSRRRRGMGAVGSNMTQILGLLAGAVAGRMLRSKVLPNVDSKIKSIGEVAVGVVLPRFVKNDFVKAMGAGMIVDGGTAALSSFGVLSGIGADDVSMEMISGSDEIQTIAGDDEMSGSDSIQTIAGIGEDEIGAFEDDMYA